MRKKSTKLPEPDIGQAPDVLDPQPGPETDAAPLRLDANLDFTSASDLAKTLSGLRGSALTIDASGVNHLGALCGQVLASASLTWKGDQVPFSIVDGSAEFVEGARLLGLRSTLELEDVRA